MFVVVFFNLVSPSVGEMRDYEKPQTCVVIEITSLEKDIKKIKPQSNISPLDC